MISSLAAECRMPLCYGGGVRSVDQVRRIIGLGAEKVALSAAAIADPSLVSRAADAVGRQSLVVVIDARRNARGDGWDVLTHNGTRPVEGDPASLGERMQHAGVGEIVINSIDRDGEMKGYDLELARAVRARTSVPLTVLGGAGSLADIEALLREFRIVGASAGSLFVFKGIYRAVLINYPTRSEKDALLERAR
jgi:imidazole glycerol-phosphate synthase subunit HisF